jgi:DNA-directed RNA polymerase specialized sigma24 family protein
VSAPDEITSLSEVSSQSTGPHGHAIFSTTNWSVVLEAQGQSPAAQEALEKLCRTYWRPVYSFVRKQGAGPEEAEDLTQSFFALLLERRNFDAVRKEKGRLRSYLLTSLKHFLVSEHRHTMTVKRGKGERPIPLTELTGAQHSEMEPAEHLTAEQSVPVWGKCWIA